MSKRSHMQAKQPGADMDAANKKGERMVTVKRTSCMRMFSSIVEGTKSDIIESRVPQHVSISLHCNVVHLLRFRHRLPEAEILAVLLRLLFQSRRSCCRRR